MQSDILLLNITSNIHENARRSQYEMKCLEDMFTPNQHTFILPTVVTVSAYDLLNPHLTKRTLAVEKCLTAVCNCNALFQIKRQSKSSCS